jgi:hypothetical protein
VFVECSAGNALTKTEFLPIISIDTMNNSTTNRIVSPDITSEMTTGICVGSDEKVEVGTIYGADMVWSRVVIEQLLYNKKLNYPLTIYDAQCSPIIRSQYYVPDHYQLMIDGWNYACEQERFRNDPSKRTNLVIGRNSRRTITNVVIGREWRRTIFMQAYEFISTLLDRFNDRELFGRFDDRFLGMLLLCCRNPYVAQYYSNDIIRYFFGSRFIFNHTIDPYGKTNQAILPLHGDRY